jgi:phosphohistidine phosphatase SixA
MRLLVRHAHAGHKRHWSGSDAERPLSIRGWAQAEGLLDTLGDLPVERLLTSPSLRCRQTLLPLAAALDLDLESVEDLGTDGDVDHLVELVAAPDSDGAVLCTHGEILGELFARLRARGAIHRGDFPAEGRPRYEKGSTWVLEGAADDRFHARYLPPAAPGTEHRWGWRGSFRAELGRLALEQQRLLGTIAALTTTTQQLAADLGPQLAALTAERAALSQLDQVRETAKALAKTHVRLVETQHRVLGGLLPDTQPASPARMVAGLTDAGAILTMASSDRGRRHSRRRWAVLAEQPLAVRADPGGVERLMVALLDAADATLPPAMPTWVIARATAAGAVVAIAADPAGLPLSGLQVTAAGRRLRPLSPRQAGASPVGQAGQLAEQLGGDLTIATDGAARASRLLLRFPLAALPDEVWPDRSPFPATDTAIGVSNN